MLTEAEIREKCNNIAASAYHGCGQSDVLFSNKLSDLVDDWLDTVRDDNERQNIIAIAERYGYTMAQYSDPDMCPHGFDYDCCPCGCG
ncbi:hypothetical protein [Acidithiobacillus caldus]|uniref:hypothetical protein n=1 Tax=Acidithiobacillus caldus TaxID=33059 RepID=UPI0009837E50|nr:hypothetical protein [Acidithiobacillus caldus]